MSAEKPAARRVSLAQPQPINRVVADRLSHPATVVHPTMVGDDAEFEVIIERIYYLSDDDDTERLCFRGKATVGSWSGYKTFFADDCRSLIDRSTGNAVENVVNWLTSLHASPDPLTAESLMRAMVDYLNRELDIKIGSMGVQISPDGVRINYTEITTKDHEAGDKPPYAAFQIFLNGVVITTIMDRITTDPLVVTVTELQVPAETIVRTLGGFVVTETTRRIPEVLSVEVTPCAEGRVDVRPAPRDRPCA